MLGRAALVAFVAATDLARARAFYEGTLGLAVLEDTPFALVLDAAGTTLRVSAVEHLSPAPFTVLGWTVPDLEAVIGALRAAGVPMVRFTGMAQDDLGAWRAPGGARVAWFADPDGNTLSITQEP